MLWADSDLTSLGGPASPDTNPAALRVFLLWAAGDRVSRSLKDQEMMLRRSWDICVDGRGRVNSVHPQRARRLPLGILSHDELVDLGQFT